MNDASIKRHLFGVDAELVNDDLSHAVFKFTCHLFLLLGFGR